MPCGACIHLHCKAIEIWLGFVFFLFPWEDTSVHGGSLFLGFLLPSCPHLGSQWMLCSVFCWVLSAVAVITGRSFALCWQGILVLLG